MKHGWLLWPARPGRFNFGVVVFPPGALQPLLVLGEIGPGTCLEGEVPFLYGALLNVEKLIGLHIGVDRLPVLAVYSLLSYSYGSSCSADYF